MKILSAMQHPLTEAQESELAGNEIVLLKDVNPGLFARLANTPGEVTVLVDLAYELIDFAYGGEFDAVILPIGSPAFQAILAIAWAPRASRPAFLFAHSARNCVEETQPDGSVKKTSAFRHQFFIHL